MSFNNFGLLPQLLRAIEDKGFNVPTPIQTEAIPVILEGKDLLAGAQTGTGKTASFALPLLQNLMSKGKKRSPYSVRALILTPTRELATQVEESVRSFTKHLPFKTIAIFGGVSINTQIGRMRSGVDVMVATPGRLLDLVGQKAVDLSHVEILVLDEADRMLDMGFMPDIRRILSLLPEQRQSLMFSATISNEIKKLAGGLLSSPQLIQLARQNPTADGVSQTIHPVDSKRKRALLSHLISSQSWKQVLVFTRTKHSADRLTMQLASDGISAAAIHGDKSQGARTKALANFKQGSVRVLVATDIAARGLDIDQLPYVVNFDLPNVPEDYIHRIGRTGRAGNNGEAVSLVCIDEHKLLRDIERLLNQEINRVVIPEYAPDPSIRAEPIMNGRGGQRSPRPFVERSGPKPSGFKPRQPGNMESGSRKRGPFENDKRMRGAPFMQKDVKREYARKS